MTSATPKPRAGEHTPVNYERDYEEIIAKLEAERDLLRARERELINALSGLTYLGKSASGVIVGPRGWEMAQAALAKVRP